jgi:ABC-type phosphate transport system substrate-binding protein/Flp pilus assembly protein TadD
VLRSDQKWLAQDSPAPTFTLQETVAAGTRLRIDGSAAMAVLNQTLADGFSQRYPGTEVSLASNGDPAALAALQAGNVDLAALGRSLSDAEKAQNLTEVPISREKIAIIVGRDNPFQGDLTFGDFARIFRGEITNWSQIGGPDLPLRFIDRPAASDVRRALGDYEVFKQQAFQAGGNAMVVGEDSTAAVVRELGKDGISYAIASEVLNQSAVRPVTMHSTQPDDPRYPYSQPRNYVYRGEASIPVEAFLGFATSPIGQEGVTTAQRAERDNVTAGANRHPGAVTLAPDGRTMVRGGEKGQLEWLDSNGQSLRSVANAHQGVVSAVVISPDGQTVISSGADGTIRRWDSMGNPVGDPFTGRGGPILTLALSPDGQTLVSGNANGTMERWSLANGTPLGEPIQAHSAAVQTLHYAQPGQGLFSGSSDGSLALWSPDGTLVKRIDRAHAGGVTQITSTPDGQLVTSSGSDGTVQAWSQATLEPQGERIQAHPQAVTALAYSSDGGTLATAGADRTLQLWGGDGTPLQTTPTTLDAVASSLDFTADGNLVVGTADNQVQQRDAQGNLLEGFDISALSPQLADLWRRMQGLPRSTWWIIAAVPLLLFVGGLLGSLLGIRRKSATTTDLSVEPLPGANLGIDFSGLGERPTPTAEVELPPEAGLTFGIEPEPEVEDFSQNKLEQARADLAEGRRLMRTGQYDLALIQFSSAIEATEVARLNAQASGAPLSGINTIASQAEAQRGHALALTEQTAEAMASYNLALRLDAANGEAWVGKGRLLTSMGRYEEALFCFDSALELDQSAGAAWYGKGQALLQLGRQAEAQTCLAQATNLGDQGMGLPLPGSLTTPPLPRPSPPPEESFEPAPAYGYDPDVPLELQQMVMGLPSADVDIAHADSLDANLPPELEQVALSAPGGDRFGYSEADLTAPVASLEEELLNQVNLVAPDWPTTDWAATVAPQEGPPLPMEAPPMEAPPVVPMEEGDFIPPPPEDPSLTSDLPPELLAAMASIPPGSPDSFDLSTAAPAAAPRVAQAINRSWVRLSIDQNKSDRFYVVWNLEEADRLQARQQGGETLAVRLYDVTGQATHMPLQPPVYEQRCHDDLAQDWYLPIPQWDRIYIAVLGYLGAADSWVEIAQSAEVPAIS